MSALDRFIARVVAGCGTRKALELTRKDSRARGSFASLGIAKESPIPWQEASLLSEFTSFSMPEAAIAP